MASVEPLKLLLSLNFDPNIVNQFKETPLFVATRTNNIDAACVLIENGVDIRIKNIHGKKSIENMIIRMKYLGYTAFDYIPEIDEWLTSKKFDEETHACLRAYKYKDIRTIMYKVSSKLDQFDARRTSNRNNHLQKSFEKFRYELNKTEQEFYQSPRLRRS
jgi:hypothetical protein